MEETQKCKYCLKPFKRLKRHVCKMKNDYIRRLELQLDIVVNEIPEDRCRFCNNGKTYPRLQNLSRHVTVCKERELYELELENRIETIRKSKQPVEKDTDTDKEVDAEKLTIHSRDININSNNTNNISINLRPFGKENLDYITREVILKLCNSPNFTNEIIPRLVKHVHCHPEHPENHNVLITNLRSPYSKVYNGDEYRVESTNDIVNKVIDNVTDKLTDAYLDNDDGKFTKYEKAITQIDDEIGQQGNLSKFKIEQRTKVKGEMYNNKKLLKETQLKTQRN